eukprot:GHVN01066479.1.p1 GENE.GHVN01066479.1~~GHVN01066479.1.p1  ORF type:complete len:1070 (+),score=151.47 GHVN01066479.1:910-4119(+)
MAQTAHYMPVPPGHMQVAPHLRQQHPFPNNQPYGVPMGIPGVHHSQVNPSRLTGGPIPPGIRRDMTQMMAAHIHGPHDSRPQMPPSIPGDPNLTQSQVGDLQKEYVYLLKLEKSIMTVMQSLRKHVYNSNRNIFLLHQWKNQMQMLQERRKPNTRGKRMSMFVDEEGQAAPSNPEAIDKAAARTHLPNYRKKYDWNVRTWTEAEKNRLDEVVKDNLRTDLARIHVDEKSRTEEHLTPEDQKLLRADTKKKLERMSIQNCLQAIESAAAKRAEEDPQFSVAVYWVNFWDDVAKNVPGRVERTGRDCQIQWMHHHDPTVNRGPWTKDEDLRIIALAAKYNGRHWQHVAYEIGTGRTAFQCFERYQRSLNKGLMRGDWTAAEDEELMRAVEQIGMKVKGPCKWNRVAARLPGRTNHQCRARYVHSLKGNLKHGGWSPEEDVRLQLLVAVYGRGNWAKIAPHMPGRTDMKCRERYENVLRPDVKKGPWTEEENRRLIDAINDHGAGNWAVIKKYITGRTDSDCARQWQRLDPFGCVLYDVIRAAKHRMLPKNHRGARRREKTALTGADFQVECFAHLVQTMESTLRSRSKTHQQSHRMPDHLGGGMPPTFKPDEFGEPEEEPEGAPVPQRREARRGKKEREMEQQEMANYNMKQLAKLKVYLDSISTGDQNADKHLSRVKRLLLRYKEKEFGLKKNSFLEVTLTEEELGTVPDAKDGIGFTMSSMRGRDDEDGDEPPGLEGEAMRAFGPHGQTLMVPSPMIMMTQRNSHLAPRSGYLNMMPPGMGHPGMGSKQSQDISMGPQHMKRHRDGMEFADDSEFIDDAYDDDDPDEQDPKRVRRRPGRPPKTDAPFRQGSQGGMHGRAGHMNYGMLPHQQPAFMMHHHGMASEMAQGMGAGAVGGDGSDVMLEDEQMAHMAQMQLSTLRQIFLQRGQDPMEADRQITEGLPLQEQTELEAVLKTIGEPIINRNGAQIHPNEARMLVQRADLMMRERAHRRQQQVGQMQPNQFEQSQCDVGSQQAQPQPNDLSTQSSSMKPEQNGSQQVIDPSATEGEPSMVKPVGEEEMQGAEEEGAP